MKTNYQSSRVAWLATIITALGLQLALAQTSPPAAFVTTDQPGYQPGATVMIAGGGFQAGETVTLQVVRGDGTACPSASHGPGSVVADENGDIQATWSLCAEDGTGTTLQLNAAGQSSARAATTTFLNGAAIAAYVTTDQADYAPGSTVYITGGGFNAGENVSVQVVHADGSGTDDPVHQPWTVVADANGAFQTAWEVGNDHLGASLQVLASRGASDPAAQTAFTDSAGPFCSYLSFNGVDDYVSTALILPDTGTIEMWYYVGPFDVNRTVFDNSVDANDWEMWVYGPNNGVTAPCTVSFRIDRNEAFNHRPSYLLPGPSRNRWYHFAVTWQRNGSSVDSTLYVDGNRRSWFVNQKWATPGNFYLAGGNPGNTKGNGRVDEVRIWNVARSQAEIQANMNGPLTGTEPGLVAYWPFNEGTGTTTADATGHGYTGTVMNGPAWLSPTLFFSQALTSDAPGGPYSMTPGGPENDQQVADSFTLVSATTIRGVRWWGAYDQTPGGPDNFVIRFFNDSNGKPGTLIGSQSGLGLTKSITSYKKDSNDVWVYSYEVQLAAPVTLSAGTRYHVSILNAPNTWWTWVVLNSASADGGHYIRHGDSGTWDRPSWWAGRDCAFELFAPNSAPVAQCQNVTVSAGANCTATASIDNGSYDPDGDPITLTQSPPSPYPLGTTAVTLTATDSKCAAASCQATVTVVDSAPPVITCPGAIVQATDAGKCYATITTTPATATDNCGATVTGVRNDGQPLNATYPKGVTTITWTATDAANNSASCAQTVTVNDTEAPSITPPANMTVEATSGAGAAVTFTASAVDACDGAVAATCAPASGSMFPLGVATVACTAVDAAGNQGNASFTVTVVDTTGPSIPAQTMMPVECNAPEGTIVNYALTALDLVDGNVPVVCVPPSGSRFPVGQSTVNCTATDAHGNLAKGAFTVTVVDTTPPVLTVPADQTVGADPGQCSAVVTFTVTASDTCCGEVTIVAEPPSGSTFPKGPTTVHCTATDAYNNQSESSFTVTVKDNENPTITAPADVLVVSDVGSSSATSVALGTPTTADNCQAGSPVNDHPSTTFPLGETLVTWTVTDASGNSATAVQKVTVLKSVAATFGPPLAGQPVGNKIRRGQVVPHKVTLVNCAGAAVTAGVTVRLKVQGIDSATGVVFQDVAEDANGVGNDGTVTSDGIMVLADGKYQFNLDTSNFGDPNTIASSTRFYRSTVTVIDNATLMVLGTVGLNLETGK